MSSVDPVGVTNPANSISSSSNNASVDYDAFLNLLVAQLKNQDPTDPTDPAQFMSQLASFSGVEQQIKTNEKMDELVMSSLFGQASTLIGRTVTSADGSTTGTVASVTMVNGGLTAILENGQQVLMGNGVNVSK